MVEQQIEIKVLTINHNPLLAGDKTKASPKLKRVSVSRRRSSVSALGRSVTMNWMRAGPSVSGFRTWCQTTSSGEAGDLS
jgi:hypothetical protein